MSFNPRSFLEIFSTVVLMPLYYKLTKLRFYITFKIIVCNLDGRKPTINKYFLCDAAMSLITLFNRAPPPPHPCKHPDCLHLSLAPTQRSEESCLWSRLIVPLQDRSVDPPSFQSQYQGLHYAYSNHCYPSRRLTVGKHSPSWISKWMVPMIAICFYCMPTT